MEPVHTPSLPGDVVNALLPTFLTLAQKFRYAFLGTRTIDQLTAHVVDCRWRAARPVPFSTICSFWTFLSTQPPHLFRVNTAA